MKPLLQNILRRAGLRLCRDTPSSRPDGVLQSNLEMVLLPVIRRLGPDFYFVEIGANDGCSTDPLHPLVREFGLRGLLVEPQPDVFARLLETYAGVDGLAFANAAITASSGTLPLYRLKKDYGLTPGVARPDFDTRVTSFDPALVLKHIGFNGPPEMVLETISVPALSSHDLLKKFQVETVSLLQIDTEGADYTILQQWDFVHHAPLVIAYEHLHLGVTAFEESIDFLLSHGYRWCKGDWDVIAVKDEEYQKLLERPIVRA